MNPINVSDNYFTERQHQFILTYCENCKYTYGEVDNTDTPPTGLIHNIPYTEEIYRLIEDRIEKSMGPDVIKYRIYRMYVNCFAPRELAYFHTDGKHGDLTFLYYPNLEWNENDLGETQFLIDGEIKGILPKPNRMLGFDADLLHRATTFRDKHRFTIAIKYS